MDDPCKHGRYGAGTPTHLAHSLRLTWREHPSPERIVEDISRLPLTIDATIERKGCQVPEEAIHRKGCSRTKRKGRSDGGLSSAVSQVASQRQGESREMARRLSVVWGLRMIIRVALTPWSCSTYVCRKVGYAILKTQAL